MMDPQGEEGAAGSGSGAAGISVAWHVPSVFGGVTAGSIAAEARIAVQKSGGEEGWSRRRFFSMDLQRTYDWKTALGLQPAGPAAKWAAIAAAGVSSGGDGGAVAAGAGAGGSGGEAGEQQQEQRQQQEQQAQMRMQQAELAAQVVTQLLRFSEWFQQGKITGSLTFYRP